MQNEIHSSNEISFDQHSSKENQSQKFLQTKEKMQTQTNHELKLEPERIQHHAKGVVQAQLSYFSPKRFNRFPRFTVFFKNGENFSESQYIVEKTVSLNSEILNYLADRKETQLPV